MQSQATRSAVIGHQRTWHGKYKTQYNNLTARNVKHQCLDANHQHGHPIAGECCMSNRMASEGVIKGHKRQGHSTSGKAIEVTVYGARGKYKVQEMGTLRYKSAVQDEHARSNGLALEQNSAVQAAD